MAKPSFQRLHTEPLSALQLIERYIVRTVASFRASETEIGPKNTRKKLQHQLRDAHENKVKEKLEAIERCSLYRLLNEISLLWEYLCEFRRVEFLFVRMGWLWKHTVSLRVHVWQLARPPGFRADLARLLGWWFRRFRNGPELKGSIGEGPNHSNHSDRSSVRILGILSKFKNFH